MVLANLDGAKYIKVYSNSQRLYAWFGGYGISVYDFNLNEIDYFTIWTSQSHNHDAFEKKVKLTIETHEDEIFMEENFTVDMFYEHEFDTGEDLEAQH